MQWLPLSRHSAQTSPGTTRFFLSIHPLHLPYMIPCSYRASACKAVLPSCMAFYVISVRQTGDLPVVSLFPHPASFRFHLAMDTLTFGYILPTTGRIRDLHPLETCAAGRTMRKAIGRFRPNGLCCIPIFTLQEDILQHLEVHYALLYPYGSENNFYFSLQPHSFG